MVAALSFLVLLVGFRSLLIPAQAAVMNLVSVGAAYGVLTLVFQEVCLEPDRTRRRDTVVSFVPLIMFAILFGLSTDYQVFLLTQIQEHFKEGKGARATVIEGLGYSGRIIGAAALVMFSVFGSFVLNGDPTIKQFGSAGDGGRDRRDRGVPLRARVDHDRRQEDDLVAPLARPDPAHQHRGRWATSTRSTPSAAPAPEPEPAPRPPAGLALEAAAEA